MPAYLIGTIHVTDPQQWQDYVDRVGATFQLYGGRVLFRGVKTVQLNRAAHGERVVVAQFDQMADLQRWHDSEHYRQLIALRDGGAEVVLTAYEG